MILLKGKRKTVSTIRKGLMGWMKMVPQNNTKKKYDGKKQNIIVEGGLTNPV